MDIASSHPPALFSSKASAAGHHGVGGPGGFSASTSKWSVEAKISTCLVMFLIWVMLLKYLIKSFRSLIVILEVYCRWYRVYGIPCPFLPGSHGPAKPQRNSCRSAKGCLQVAGQIQWPVLQEHNYCITLHGLPIGFACGFVPSDKSMPLPASSARWCRHALQVASQAKENKEQRIHI